MSHTRRAHPALRVTGEVISEHIISEVLLDEKRRTHVIVGDHAPEPRVDLDKVPTRISMLNYGPGLFTQEDHDFLDRNRWRL